MLVTGICSAELSAQMEHYRSPSNKGKDYTSGSS